MSHSALVRPEIRASSIILKRGAALLLSAGILVSGLVAAAPAFADEGAPGTVTISASASSIAPGDRAFVSVHRTGGTHGAVSVSVDSAALPAELASVIAPIDTEVTFLDGDADDKTVPIVFLGDDVPGDLPGDDLPGDDANDIPGLGTGAGHAATSVFASRAFAPALAPTGGGSAPLTVWLSAPTGGAALGTPSSVSISVATPPTTTPVDGGSDTTGSTTGGTTTPGASSNSSGTTSPIGGGQSLADTGVDAILPFVVATLAAIAGLATVLLVRRRRAADMN